MRTAIIKSLGFGLVSVVASLSISFIAVRTFGGALEGVGLAMTIVCPLLISIPLSFMELLRGERLKKTKTELDDALKRLGLAYAEMKAQSETDTLTGFLNSQTFMARLSEKSRQGIGGAILFIDLDHFKSINDTFGHHAGDLALRRAAEAMGRFIGPLDLAGRIGGEEFALFKEALFEDAAPFADALCRAVRRADAALPSGQKIDLSASIGVARCSRFFDPEAALMAADRRLYAAKRAGRNRVIAEDREAPDAAAAL